MPFAKLEDLLDRFAALGANRVLCKRLAENDNSKQQVYLGGSFDALQLLPFKEIRAEPGTKRETFKADLDFAWIDSKGHAAKAPGAKLILYPKYPEVRLSGFLQSCPIAPSRDMQPIPKSRRTSGGPDGRLLFLATTPANSVLAYLAVRGDMLAAEFESLHLAGRLLQAGVFLEVPLRDGGTSRQALLSRLRAIHLAGWHSSRRLNSSGVAIPYSAQNGGGYTLEALLGIVPNGISAPDFQGWELKAIGSGRVTLMTPEPDAGYYGRHGVEAFVRRYGRALDGDVLYFTGTHYADRACAVTGQTLAIRGFNSATGKIEDVKGSIDLVDPRGVVSASWTFTRLIEHWARKHAAAAYVPYGKQAAAPPNYRYLSPVLLGEGTDFPKYLSAIGAGMVVYDPGSKITAASSRPRVKARSQFRISVGLLSKLYDRFERVTL